MTESAGVLEPGPAQMVTAVPRSRGVLVAPEAGVFSVLYGTPGGLGMDTGIQELCEAWREQVMLGVEATRPVSLRRAWSRLCMERVPRGSHAGMVTLQIHDEYLTLTHSGRAAAYLIRGARVRLLTQPHDILGAYLRGNGVVVSSGRSQMFSDGMLMQEHFQRVEAPKAGPGRARFWSDRHLLTPSPGDLFVLTSPEAVRNLEDARTQRRNIARLAVESERTLTQRARAVAQAMQGEHMVERGVVLVAF